VTTAGLTGAAGLRSRFVAAREWLGRFPMSLLQLGMRIGVGLIFFNAGIIKYKSFEFTVKLFEDIYKVPILDPAVAARITMVNEITLPVLLFLGLATRLATLPLLGQLVVMEYALPKAWSDNLFWATVLLFILTRGPGKLSVDHLIERYFAKRQARDM
jgi:putative oxidoreductase